MSVFGSVMGGLFGNGRNVIAETTEIFRINKEAEAQRGADMRAASLAQFSQEFQVDNRGRFDRFMDGLNRIPRPAMAFGTLGLFISAMINPIWFSERMVGLAVIPDPLWWLLGAIVSFYFGARYQAKGQEFRRDITRTVAMTPNAVGKAAAEPTVVHDANPASADDDGDNDNPALKAWKKAA